MEWISVEDEKPPRGESVLMADHTGSVMMGLRTGNDRYIIYYPIGGGDDAEYPITYWMPLPDPPQDAPESS